ncbi:hypothetical protein [Mesorhizobium sp. Cs1299R1N3]
MHTKPIIPAALYRAIATAAAFYTFYLIWSAVGHLEAALAVASRV